MMSNGVPEGQVDPGGTELQKMSSMEKLMPTPSSPSHEAPAITCSNDGPGPPASPTSLEISFETSLPMADMTQGMPAAVTPLSVDDAGTVMEAVGSRDEQESMKSDTPAPSAMVQPCESPISVLLSPMSAYFGPQLLQHFHDFMRKPYVVPLLKTDELMARVSEMLSWLPQGTWTPVNTVQDLSTVLNRHLRALESGTRHMAGMGQFQHGWALYHLVLFARSHINVLMDADIGKSFLDYVALSEGPTIAEAYLEQVNGVLRSTMVACGMTVRPLEEVSIIKFWSANFRLFEKMAQARPGCLKAWQEFDRYIALRIREHGQRVLTQIPYSYMPYSPFPPTPVPQPAPTSSLHRAVVPNVHPPTPSDRPTISTYPYTHSQTHAAPTVNLGSYYSGPGVYAAHSPFQFAPALVTPSTTPSAAASTFTPMSQSSVRRPLSESHVPSQSMVRPQAQAKQGREARQQEQRRQDRQVPSATIPSTVPSSYVASSDSKVRQQPNAKQGDEGNQQQEKQYAHMPRAATPLAPASALAPTSEEFMRRQQAKRKQTHMNRQQQVNVQESQYARMPSATSLSTDASSTTMPASQPVTHHQRREPGQICQESRQEDIFVQEGWTFMQPPPLDPSKQQQHGTKRKRSSTKKPPKTCVKCKDLHRRCDGDRPCASCVELDVACRNQKRAPTSTATDGSQPTKKKAKKQQQPQFCAPLAQTGLAWPYVQAVEAYDDASGSLTPASLMPSVQSSPYGRQQRQQQQQENKEEPHPLNAQQEKQQHPQDGTPPPSPPTLDLAHALHHEIAGLSTHGLSQQQQQQHTSHLDMETASTSHDMSSTPKLNLEASQPHETASLVTEVDELVVEQLC